MIAFNYYYPSFGGLIAIDSFKYNTIGEMIARIGTNILSPQYNYIEHYAYNLRGNVTKIDIASHNGGTVFIPGYTEFLSLKYDAKANFTSGSLWTKFLFFHSGYDGFPFLWNMFSMNNAVNYQWLQDAAGDGLLAFSTINYNNKGFANAINIDFSDLVTGEDYGVFTRTSSSTCDNALSNLLSSKSLLFKEKINTNRYGLPLVIK